MQKAGAREKNIWTKNKAPKKAAIMAKRGNKVHVERCAEFLIGKDCKVTGPQEGMRC